MARKSSPDDVVARGEEDVALQLAGAPTRDALLDPRDGDYIPENDSKGYHVGTVRQPAEPVARRDGSVGFESTGDGESKFETAADQKARSNAREADNPDLYGANVHVPITVDASDVTGTGTAERLRSRGIAVNDDSNSGGE